MAVIRKNIAPVVAAALAPQAGDLAKAAVESQKATYDIIKPVLYGGAAIGGIYLAKKIFVGRQTEALWSAPVLVGGAGMYAVGAAVGLKDEAKIALSVAGIGLGWAVQYYLLAPIAQEAEIAADEAQRKADWRWYNPLSWGV